MTTTTEKRDWLNDFIASHNGFYVSSHDTFSKELGLPVELDVSVRFVGNQRIGFSFFLVIISPEGSPLLNKKVDGFIKDFSLHFSKEISIIIANKAFFF